MFKLCHYKEIDSTNLEAKRLVESSKIPNKTVIYADKQLAGQGSRGRNWSSNKEGNLLASFILPVPTEWQKPHLALYPVSFAVKKFIDHLLQDKNAQVELKWPNDILINQKKVCGCLHEIISDKKNKFFIAGIGLNVAWHPEQTSSSLPPTSINEFAEIDLPMAEIVKNLSEHIEQEIQEWQHLGFRSYLKKLIPHFYRFGETIAVLPSRERDDKITGEFHGIDTDGALILKTISGTQKITAADIFPNLS